MEHDREYVCVEYFYVSVERGLSGGVWGTNGSRRFKFDGEIEFTQEDPKILKEWAMRISYAYADIQFYETTSLEIFFATSDDV